MGCSYERAQIKQGSAACSTQARLSISSIKAQSLMDVVARACSSIMLSASTVRDTIMKKADECEGSQTDACDASAVTHVSGRVCSCISCTAALLNGAWMSCGKRDLASCGTHHRFFHEILRPTRKEAALHGCDKRLHWQAGRVRARPACSEGVVRQGGSSGNAQTRGVLSFGLVENCV